MTKNYQEFKSDFNSKLEQWLEQKQNDFSGRYKEGLTDDILSQIETISSAKGKRIRPFVAWLMSNNLSDRKPPDWSPFLAIELFHLFGLIHDDIMDRDQLRRGEQTIHEFISEKNFSSSKDSNHIGNSLAILAGDLVHSWVNELFVKTEGYPQEYKRAAQEKFFTMSEEVMVGQIMDMDNRSDKDIEYLFKKMSLKTASYTFIRPMQIGVALGGGSDELFDFCEKWGQKMGLAFQIQDNLLDFTSDDTGKDDFSDIKEANVNILTYFVRKNEPKKFEQILEPNLGSEDISSEDKKDIKNLFQSSGAIEYCENQVEDYLNQSKKMLQEYPLTTEISTELNNLINLLENRKK